MDGSGRAQPGENFSRPGSRLCECPHSTHDERNSHRGAKALAPDEPSTASGQFHL